jgi:alkylated DNA nucleotide flippase Atl1
MPGRARGDACDPVPTESVRVMPGPVIARANPNHGVNGVCGLTYVTIADIVFVVVRNNTMETTMTEYDAAVADLSRAIGFALSKFADAISPPSAVVSPEESDLTSLGLGKRQQQIAELPGVNSDAGLRASEISSEIEYDTANTHTALKALKERGVLEELRTDPDQPPRWRLAPAFRGVSDPYLRMAGFLRPGEWTTYGDISIAVRGDTSAARAVGRAAATLPHFPTPHRVLWSGGRVPPTWKSSASATPDPEECLRRLREENVAFDDKGHASRKNYVSWDVLVQRSDNEG